MTYGEMYIHILHDLTGTPKKHLRQAVALTGFAADAILPGQHCFDDVMPDQEVRAMKAALRDPGFRSEVMASLRQGMAEARAGLVANVTKVTR